MITFLANFFIPNKNDTSLPQVRTAYGLLCGSVGIFLNLILFAGKLTAGMLSQSIAITADAFNNLSDAGSSLITIIGFKMSGKRPDPNHPFGHGSIEYVTGLFVSLSIIIMAVELINSSFLKVLKPAPTKSSWLILVILAVSILVKIYMFLYNRSIGKEISSTVLSATAADSFSDSIATTVVLASTIFSRYTGLSVDGYCGMLVGLFIFYNGYKAARETLSPLLGQPPEPEFVAQIEKIVLSGPHIIGMHDLIVHNYGPGRIMISLHAEVPADMNILVIHDTIDNIETALKKELLCDATIHMDPVMLKDPFTTELKSEVAEILENHSEVLSFHDFRLVKGPTHTNVVFDILLPMDFNGSESELFLQIEKEIQEKLGSQYHCVIQFDRSYAL